MVVTAEEYTKHYYIEGERVCSKIGGGFGVAPMNPLGTTIPSLNGGTDRELADATYHLVEKSVECTGFNPSYIGLDNEFKSLQNNASDEGNDLYFYHSDHLGSSAFITDASGNAYQHLQYLPFGESYIDQRHGQASRYTFSGKEKDEETSYSYFGARYYDSELSVWLSVDPLASGRPGLTPYHYCQNNPLNRVDPNGMWDSDHVDLYGNLIAHYDDGDNSVYVHKRGTTKAQIDAQRAELKNTGGRGAWLGELGGNINVSEIMSNKLKVSSAVAKELGIAGFYNAVKTGRTWDLKNNKETVFGVAWAYDLSNSTKTTFSFSDYTNMTAADVGNYHFGYAGKYTYGGEGMDDNTLCMGAGVAEIKKNIFNEGKILTGLNGISQLVGSGPVLYGPRPPFGDRIEDFLWISVGIIDADKSKK